MSIYNESQFIQLTQCSSDSYLSSTNQYGTEKDFPSDSITKIISSLLQPLAIDSGLLPPGLKASIPGFLIFERPPSYQMVQLANMTLDDMSDCDYEDINIEGLRIPVPWQLYMVSYGIAGDAKYIVNSVRMYYMNSPLNSLDNILYSPPIPNFFANGLLCNPHFEDMDDLYRYPKNLSGVIAAAYDWVWNTGFNRDLLECIDQSILQRSPRQLISLLHDPNQPTNDNYINYYHHLSTFTLDQVVSMTWPNPSFSTHFGSDLSYFMEQQQYIDDFYNDHEYDPEDTSIDSSEFSSWIGDLAKITKTYAMMIESFDLNTNHHFKNYQSLFHLDNKLTSLLSV